MSTTPVLQPLRVILLLLVGFWAVACGTSAATVRHDTPALLTQAAPHSDDNDGLLEVHIIDVGQGDGFAIITPNDRVVVVDSGPPASAGAFSRALRQLGIWRINLAVITHAHSDHIGGFERVLDDFEVLRFADPGFPHTSSMYANLLERILQMGIPIFELRRGRWIQLDEGIEAVVLAPPEQLYSGTRSDANANSIVLLLTYREVAIVLMADAEAETEMQVARDGLLGPVNVLKVSHHGSGYSSIEAFLRVAQPTVAVISCGEGNSFGHPSEETLERLQPYATGGIYRTDLDGTVTIRTDGFEIYVETEREGGLISLWPLPAAGIP